MLANGAGGGLWRRGHDDGVRGGAPARCCALWWLTKLYQRHGRRQWVDGEPVEVLRWLDGEAEQAGDRQTTVANCSAAAERTQAKEELRK